MKLETLKNYIAANGGATITNKGELLAARAGYMVSLANTETKTTLDGLNRAIMARYMKEAKKRGAYVGLWIDNGVLYLDLSQNIEDKREAINTGRENKQLAIYDLKNQTSIYLQ